MLTFGAGMACSNDQCEGDPTPYRLSSGGWSHDPTDTGDDVVCPGPAEPLADAAITRGRDTHICCETSVSDSTPFVDSQLLPSTFAIERS